MRRSPDGSGHSPRGGGCRRIRPRHVSYSALAAAENVCIYAACSSPRQMDITRHGCVLNDGDQTVMRNVALKHSSKHLAILLFLSPDIARAVLVSVATLTEPALYH